MAKPIPSKAAPNGGKKQKPALSAAHLIAEAQEKLSLIRSQVNCVATAAEVDALFRAGALGEVLFDIDQRVGEVLVCMEKAWGLARKESEAHHE